MPHKARGSLLARHEKALARLQLPLQQARSQAQAAREQLLARARALADEAAARGPAREDVLQVRELQTAWQQQAKALPLPRGVENALWSNFKAATDAVFNARDAAFQAREAEFQSHAAERTALIQRLAALTLDTPAPEIRRTVEQCIAQWQRCGPAPRAQADDLERSFRASLGTAQALLSGYEQQAWQAQCDALLAKLALCEAQEAGPATHSGAQTPAQADEPLLQHWATLRGLPAPWEKALRQRAGLDGDAPVAAARDDPDPLLLQLESAWGLPSPPESAEARRQLKLQAMKAAMETRRQPSAAAPDPDVLMARLLRRQDLQPAQRERLLALVAALRRRRPG